MHGDPCRVTFHGRGNPSPGLGEGIHPHREEGATPGQEARKEARGRGRGARRAGPFLDWAWFLPPEAVRIPREAENTCLSADGHRETGRVLWPRGSRVSCHRRWAALLTPRWPGGSCPSTGCPARTPRLRKSLGSGNAGGGRSCRTSRGHLHKAKVREHPPRGPCWECQKELADVPASGVRALASGDTPDQDRSRRSMTPGRKRASCGVHRGKSAPRLRTTRVRAETDSRH